MKPGNLLAAGIPLLALWGTNSNGACGCPRGDSCRSAGKHPVGKSWQLEGPLWTAEEVKNRMPVGGNVGAATGHAMKDGRVLFVWDVDTDNGKSGSDSMLKLSAEGKTLPRDCTTRTGGGGEHIWLAAPPGTTVSNHQGIVPGVDIRGEGGQVVIPPSRSNKGSYAFVSWGEVPDAPQWVLEMLAEKRPDPEIISALATDLPERWELSAEEIERCDDLEAWIQYKIKSDFEAMKTLPPGASLGGAGGYGSWGFGTVCRAKDLFRLANSPWSLLTPERVADIVLEQAPQDTGHNADVVRASIARAARETAGVGLNVPEAPPVPKRAKDDIGNGYRLWDHHADRLLWVENTGYFKYANGLWRGVTPEHANGLVQDMIEALPRTEALWYRRTPMLETDANGLDVPRPSERQIFVGWAKEQREAKFVKNCLSLAVGRNERHVELNDFDADDSIVNVANGILRIGRGWNGARTLEEHSPKHLTTLQIPVAFDETAECPSFEKLTRDMFPDEGIRRAFQGTMGYSVFVDKNPDKIMPILLGKRDSGKTTALEIVSAIAPSVVKTFELSMFRAKRDGGPQPDLYDVLKARMIYTTESSGEWNLHGDLIKRLTGNDKVRARPNFARATTERIPSFVPWIGANEMPSIVGADHALLGRLKVFNVTPPTGPLDRELSRKVVREEASGVLNWLLEGYDIWRTGEIVTLLEKLDKDTEAAFIDTSVFAQFMENESDAVEGYWEPASHVIEAWYAYAEKTHQAEFTVQRVGRELSGLNWERGQGRVIDGEGVQKVRVGRRLKSCPKCRLAEMQGKKHAGWVRPGWDEPFKSGYTDL